VTLVGPWANVSGDRRRVQIPQPFYPWEESHISIIEKGGERTLTFSTGMGVLTPAREHFHDCILDRPMPWHTAENALGTLRVIVAAFRFAQMGGSIRLSR